MFPESEEFVKVDKFVIKHKTRPWDSFWNKDTQTWGGLIQATRFTEEELKLGAITEPEVMEVLNFDTVIGLK